MRFLNLKKYRDYNDGRECVEGYEVLNTEKEFNEIRRTLNDIIVRLNKLTKEKE